MTQKTDKPNSMDMGFSKICLDHILWSQLGDLAFTKIPNALKESKCQTRILLLMANISGM